MKILILTGFLMMSALSVTSHGSQRITDERHAYAEIHTSELKAWYDQGKNMVVLDARSKEYYEGTLLPQAIWLPYNVPDNNLKEALPSKDTLIVVYCWNPNCPASRWMADRLVIEGYTNVYKYSEGLQEWMQRGLPTTKR